jgi:hypothetical protein
MKRKILIVLLSLGTVGGFGAGFASMGHKSCHRRAAFERHVSQLCVDAALRSRDNRAHDGRCDDAHGVASTYDQPYDQPVYDGRDAWRGAEECDGRRGRRGPHRDHGPR